MSNVKVVQAVYAAFARGDVPAILDRLRDDVEWEHDAMDHGLSWMKPRRGRAEVKGFFEVLGEIELTRFEPCAFLEGPDQVMALCRIEAKVKATGRNFKDLEAHLWTFDREGRVQRFRHFVDTHQVVMAARG